MIKLSYIIDQVLLAEKLWKITVIRIPRGTIIRKKYDSKLRNARYMKRKLLKQYRKVIGDIKPI